MVTLYVSATSLTWEQFTPVNIKEQLFCKQSADSIYET